MLREIFNYKDLNPTEKSFLLGLMFMQVGIILYSFEIATGFNFPIVRYGVIAFSYYYYLKFIVVSRIEITFVSVFLVLWTCFMILMSTGEVLKGANNYLLLKRILSGDLLYYILPLLSLCSFSVLLLRKIFLISFVFAFLGCFLVPLSSFLYQNFRVGEDSAYGFENLSRIFTASGSIVFLTFNYHKKHINAIVIFSILISLGIFLVLARRNMIVYYFAVLTFAFLVLLTSKLLSSSNRLARGVLIVVFTSVVFFVFYEYRGFFAYTIGRFESGFQSREGITEEFIYDFNSSPGDWFVGRGIFGSFRTSILASNERFGLRDGIENGYLLHILKGGLVYLFLLVLLAGRALWRGFRRNRNDLIKAFCFIIIIYFIDMVGFGIPENHLKFLIVWVAISTCNNYNVLRLKDKELKSVIGL